MQYQTVARVARHVTEVPTTVQRDFEHAKIEDISDCRTTARHRMDRSKRLIILTKARSQGRDAR